jgi:hypothetical protein
MSSALQIAVLRTVLYADVFSFALSPREIHHFLIHPTRTTPDAVDTAITALTHERGPLLHAEGYVCLRSRPELIALRQQRERSTAHLLPVAERYGRWLSRLPFIRMVALTGALAVRNAAPNDDIDYLIVTTKGRVWLARAFSIALVKWARRSGYVICPNYVLAETALAQERTDLFIAHELAQMLPLYGEALYGQMRQANPWANNFLPNATHPIHSIATHHQQPLFKRAAEWLLCGRLGDWLESWEQQRKLRRFSAELRTPHHDARLDGEHVKGHFNDHGHRVLEAYRMRLHAYNCAEETAAAD